MTQKVQELWRRMWRVVAADYRRFYGCGGRWRLLAGLLVAALLANTPADQRAQDWYQRNLRNPSSDCVYQGVERSAYQGVKMFGESKVVVACSLLAALGALHPATATIGAWGVGMLRAVAVAAPPLFIGQRLLGASRPKDGRGSVWRCGDNDNAISGHAMGGALPFLVAAAMTTHPVTRIALVAGSGLTAMSRVNSNSHYFSQVMMGWWLAWLAVRAWRRPTDAGGAAGETATAPAAQ